MLSCDVVVRCIDYATTIVEAFDPDAMVSFAGDDPAGDALRAVATDVRERLTPAIAELEEIN